VQKIDSKRVSGILARMPDGKSGTADVEDPDIRDFQKSELKAFHLVKLVCIYFIPILAFVFVLVVTANLLIPFGFRWLTPEELSGLKDTFVSILSGVATAVCINFFYKNHSG